MSTVHESEILTGARLDTVGNIQLTASSAHIRLDPIDRGRSWSLIVRIITGSAYGLPAIGFQGAIWNPSRYALSGATRSFVIDADLPLDIDISGLRYGTRIAVTVECSGPLDGPRRLALLAYTPRMEMRGKLFGTAVFNAATFPDETKTRPWAIFEQSFFDRSQFPVGGTLYSWYPIHGPATEITYTRGITYNGFTGNAEPGTLSARIYNDLDPRASSLIRGTPIVLIDCATRTRLFTGTIDKTISTPAKDGTYTVEISAIDAIGELAATTKYQETRRSAVRWDKAMRELIKDRPISTTLSGDGRPYIGDMVKEASLTEWIDIYAATAGIVWWADRYGVITMRASPASSPVAAIVMDGVQSSSLPVLEPVDAVATVDTSTAIATIEATNNSAVRNEQGEWQGTTTTVRATNATIAAEVGNTRLTIETAAGNIFDLQTLLNSAVEAYTPHQVLDSVTVTPWHEATGTYRETELNTLISLEVMDPVATAYRGTEATQHITQITQTIMPTSWTTSLTLTQWKGTRK